MLRDFVAGFGQLQYLDFFTKKGDDEGSELEVLKLPELARSFGERCPSLRAIRFSMKSPFTVRSSGEWIGLQDIERLCEVAYKTFDLEDSVDRTAGQNDPTPSRSAFITPELREELLNDLETSLIRISMPLGYQGATVARALDVMSPESDADMVVAITLAYRALRRLLDSAG
ncbi:hypothetical protein L226DRAFT_286904 [Lentinus tigrinus ALCF2SS1-7]|uniref:uncharacterized protein n=1 Tax=Lentinus tigrinus ALCF2SS1-7 TaxID=1328758 RepID=UPI001165E525|nr:hypothetical protein L226DRAFT_286904 [Lentinus tigrinus ALCF2SS1-7]